MLNAHPKQCTEANPEPEVEDGFIPIKHYVSVKDRIREYNVSGVEEFRPTEDVNRHWARRDSNPRPSLCENGKLASGISHPLCSVIQIDWKKFEEYVTQNSSGNKARYSITLAKKHYGILITHNASELLSLTQWKRSHVMCALSRLSKFLGIYNEWRQTIQNYGLKWQTKRIINPLAKTNITEMIQWLKEIKTIVPNDIWSAFLFDTLTGLRASECLNAIRLIQEGEKGYYDEQLGVIQHFKFPEIFIRNSKNAYISVAAPEMIEIATQATASYNRIHCYIKRQNHTMRMKYCRKIFATYLRQRGIVKEDIDLLQGRSNQGIFEQHYYSPDMKKLISDVTQLLGDLKREIEA